jgi:FixJ family two-component response regulator
MPFLTGSQLAKEIKSSAPNVPIVLISGYTATATGRDREGDAGAHSPQCVGCRIDGRGH